MARKSPALVLGAGVLAFVGGLAWLVGGGDAHEPLATTRGLDADALPAAPVEIAGPGTRVELDAGDAELLGAAHDLRSGRELGVEVEAPDALRAVRGRIVDAQSGEPVAGLKLQFLSRRPKNVVATTDPNGEFQTERELASGVVAVSHVPDPKDPRFAGRHEIEPAEFLLPRADDAAPPFPVLFGARSPRRVFEVDVRRPDGLPASDASVSLSSGRRDERGLFVAVARDFEVADPAGRARFALFGDDAFTQSYRLEAEHGATLVSEPREFDPPLPLAPERVDLYPGALLRVTVKNDEGRLVPGVSLWLSSPDASRFTTGRRGETDAAGEFVFTGLRETCWTVSAVHPWTGESVERAVDLAAGQYADVELRLSVQNLRLGALGVVLDERGDPLSGVAVHVQVPGASAVEIATDAAGRFQFFGLEAPTLLLGFGGGFLDDLYEPGVLSVPFGATGIVVRRVERRTERHAPIEVVDGTSGARCVRAVVWLSRPESASLTGTVAVQRTSAPSGVASLALPLGEATRYAVDAPGYLRAEGDLADLLQAARDGAPLRVELRPGFERKVEVRDRVTRALLADAAFFGRDGVLGLSDASGRAILAAPEWPGVVRVECTGYVPLAWDPLAAGWPGTVVWMEPVRPR